MKTTITFKVVQANNKTTTILDAIEEAFGEFDRIVKYYTRFDDSSELSKLNAKAGEWVEVSDEFLYLIKYMFDLAEKTNGIFDPTIIDFLEIYGYDKNYDFSKLDNPDLDKIVEDIATNRPSYKDIGIDVKSKKVKLAVRGNYKQRIDLGGVGKGYAIDCAYKVFSKYNIENFLIDAGGDLRSRGRNENDKLWVASLLHQDRDGKKSIVGSLELDDKALACSGSWARKVKQFHHLINPTTGRPENKLQTVYVMADTATEADAWATAIFVGGETLKDKIPENLPYHFI